MTAYPSPAADWLTAAERRPVSIRDDGTLMGAINCFHDRLDLRLLPVVDAFGRPIGAVHERDVRLLLLNPFGHALMRNPAYGATLSTYVRACPIADVSLGLDALLELYHRAGGTDGMVVTEHGRLLAVVPNRRLVQLSGETRLAEARERVDRAARVEGLVARFEAKAAALSISLGELALQVEANSNDTAGRAAAAGGRAAAVAVASQQTEGNMSEIASRGRELASALEAVGEHTITARAAAALAVEAVAQGSVRAADLRETAGSIDDAISLITDISAKVNLLAINATIEAARAGEAGRGFTVVANEVKTLSGQTAAAAKAIMRDVDSIHGAIQEVVAGHAHIEEAIGTIADLSNGIEAAVSAQEATTRTIARNVEEAVDASESIRQDVEAIGGSAREAAGAAGEMAGFAKQLFQTAQAMQGEVESFLAEVRAA